jgi:L-threonylcarbamoyladenylate synthase
MPPSTDLIQQPTPAALDKAIALLQEGGLVALPTETVYGLGADASNIKALKRLYSVKGRPGNHPVIVHLAHQEQLTDWAKDIPEEAWQLAQAFWPGPLTLILPRSERVPDEVTGRQETVGLRIPNHPVARALLEKFGGGIAAPSANRFGRVSPTTAEHVLTDLGQDVDLILNGGACTVGVESTIVAFSNNKPVILRPGMITAEQIEAVLKQSPLSSTAVSVRASGTLASHYAPHTPVTLLAHDALITLVQNYPSSSEPIGVLAPPVPSLQTSSSIQWQAASLQSHTYAQELYANLRLLDQSNLSHIYIETVPNAPEWLAVSDRLKRAAHKE